MVLYTAGAFAYHVVMTPFTDPVETEVKFHITDPSAMRARVTALGARSLGRSHERNICFEDEGRNLIRRKCLLRLRQDRKTTLTFKSPPADADPAFKQFVELEAEVADFDAMQRILAALGYHPEQTYEKWRETLLLERTTFCLDALPFGDFLEIEGPKDAIIDATGRLELDWRKRIVLNYLEIFDQVRMRHNLPFHDVTFDNFAASAVQITAVLHLLEADPPQPPEG
jgi:adenylate cyclase, class 2